MSSYIITFLTAALITLGTLFQGCTKSSAEHPDSVRTSRLWTVWSDTSSETGSTIYFARVTPLLTEGVPKHREESVGMAFACSDGDFSILVDWGTFMGTESQRIGYQVGVEGEGGILTWITLSEINTTYLGGIAARALFLLINLSPDKRIALSADPFGTGPRSLGFDLTLINESTRDIRRFCNL